MATNDVSLRMTPSHPGDFIRMEVIEEHGLTITEAARILGVRRATLSALLNGRAVMSAEMGLRIEKAFAVSMDMLLRMQAWHDATRMRARAHEIAVVPYEEKRERANEQMRKTTTPRDLWYHYPKLYHIAWGGSWESIEEHGLLSTKALLQLYGKNDEEVSVITRARRSHWVKIDCPGRPRAVLRDQKPMTDEGLRRALPDSVELWRWYELINSMVFFWPTKKRLEKMISAPAYKEVKHDVLVVDTRLLVEMEEPNIRLSCMNSGSTKPMPHPRDMNLFKRFEDYPFEERRRKHGVAKAVAEVCVVDRIERISEAVLDVNRGTAGEVMEALDDR